MTHPGTFLLLLKYAAVVMDNGKIVRSWREVVGEKYSNLPGIRDLHDFLALCNPGHNVVLKVRETCYAGTLRDTPMKIIDELRVALPTVNHSYHALKRVKELSDNKKKDLRQMCTNFPPTSFKGNSGMKYLVPNYDGRPHTSC